MQLLDSLKYRLAVSRLFDRYAYKQKMTTIFTNVIVNVNDIYKMIVHSVSYWTNHYRPSEIAIGLYLPKI